jgi:hypothetical protein
MSRERAWEARVGARLAGTAHLAPLRHGRPNVVDTFRLLDDLRNRPRLHRMIELKIDTALATAETGAIDYLLELGLDRAQ